MKIDKYENLSKDKYRLFLDNGEVIDTYDDVILENNLLMKKDLDLKTYNKILNDSNISDSYHSCLKYISIRVRSKKEIEDYLKKKKIANDSIQKIVTRLEKEKFLNDSYFVDCFIKDKLRFTSWGPYKVKNELMKHNIDTDIIDKYISNINEADITLKIDKLIAKQIKSNHKLDNYRLKNKIYNNLVNLGYKASTVIDILNDKL